MSFLLEILPLIHSDGIHRKDKLKSWINRIKCWSVTVLASFGAVLLSGTSWSAWSKRFPPAVNPFFRRYLSTFTGNYCADQRHFGKVIHSILGIESGDCFPTPLLSNLDDFWRKISLSVVFRKAIKRCRRSGLNWIGLVWSDTLPTCWRKMSF